MLASPSKSLFHSVAVGFIVGYGIVFLPVFFLILAFSDIAQHMDPGGAGIMLVGVPLILVLNGYLLSAFVMFGLWLLSRISRRGSETARNPR
jgi:hypothetical protein